MSTLTIPVTLVAGTNENVNDVVTNFNAVASWANGNVGSTNIATSGVATANIAALAVTDAKLASANNSVWKTLSHGAAGFAGNVTAATYFCSSDPTWTRSDLDMPNIITTYLDSTEFTVGSLTTRLRLRVNALTNAQLPNATFAFSLYRITASAGASGALTYSFAALVTGSTATHTTPAATSQLTAVSTEFAVPTTGHYAVGVVSSATTHVDSRQSFTWQLQTRNT